MDNPIQAPEARRLHALLQHWARTRSDHAALKTPTVTITFAQLLAQVRSAATELQALGITAGDVVAFQLPNWAEAFALYHAVLCIDAIALPLLPALRDRDLSYMLQETQARLFITPTAWRGVDHAAMARRVCSTDIKTAVMREPHEDGPLLREFGRGEALAQWPADWVAPVSMGGLPGRMDAVCSIIFTSGTSGRPKAVLYTHRGMGIEGREMAHVDGIVADDVLFVPPSIGHVSGLSFGIYMALHSGATVCLLPDWNPQRAVELIEREQCSWTAGATPFLQGLVAAAQLRPGGLTSMRVFRCGGASVPPGLIRQARALGIDAYRSYGLSEHPTVSGRAGQPDAVCSHADGIVHRLIEVRIADPNNAKRDVEPGAEGEILTRGPDLSLAYLRQADTAATRSDGWLLTGDLGRLSSERVLCITGRKKDIIIRKGENISAKEIEDLLAEHPAVADVAVVGVAEAERGEMVCCVIVSQGDTPPTLQELCRHLREQGLALFKQPERLVVLPQLPYNVGGKVRKQALRAMLAGDAGALHADGP